jgi:arylsulfatase A-like enzyme/tetratricopeptide (TPR) repeat protein
LSRFISTRWPALVAGIVTLLVLVSLIGRFRPDAPTAARQPGLNVLLVTIDTLRADAVGAYGQPGGITPWIDRLSSAGARFSNAHAHNVVTLPSHANILSGRLPTEHGVRDNAGFRFPPSLDTLATILKAHGYRTGAFVSAFPLDSRFGLARGFDEYDDRFADAARPAFLVQERSGPETVASARRWMDSRADGPWFCWVHLYEPHYPYAPPSAVASRFADPYHGDVNAADAALEPLLAPILSAGRDGRTLVVLTSDHGESLGEHGEATHGVFAYEAALKVPLIVYQPRLVPVAVVERPARHVDLLPTILDAVAIESPSGLPGQSLLPSMRESREATGIATYFEALSAALNRRWAPLDGIVVDSMKYIELPIPELYDLKADPHELNNLVSSQPVRVEELRSRLQQLRGTRASVTARAEPAETRERLRSLGYVAGSASGGVARFTEADDPKRLIGFDARLQEIVSQYLAGDLKGALARCRALLRERPDMPLTLFHLAHLEREDGNLDGAIDALRKAVAIVPDNSETVAMLGGYLTQAGRPAQALDVLDPFARLENADVEVLTSRALALARLRRFDEALAELSRARNEDPSNGRLLLEAGTIHLMAGDRGQAREAWNSALALNPTLARAHTSLGVLSLQEGRPAEAIEHWSAATAIDPREYRTILGIGLSLAKPGQTAEARAALEFFVAHAPPSTFAGDIDRARGVLASLR